jgi:hypothetical protein
LKKSKQFNFFFNEEYVKPVRENVRKLEDQMLAANLEKKEKNEILLPSGDEIGTFAQEVRKD